MFLIVFMVWNLLYKVLLQLVSHFILPATLQKHPHLTDEET